MNFLAHIYLSGDDEELLIGNFIADYVKGSNKNSYPERIKKGIELHRAIDEYTDHHPITSLSKERLFPIHHKYSGPLVDIYFDHFLAKNFNIYSSIPLIDFTSNAYDIILRHKEILPQRIIDFLPFMIERNWLFNYSTIEGIGRTMTGIGRRLSFPNKFDTAVNDLVTYYTSFETEFLQFFPELINFAESKR